MRRALTSLEWLALAALVLLAIARASLPLSHDDLFGHLRTGEWVAEHGSVPKADPFSFTRPGERWITHEWGFSLLAWGVWLLGGYPGLIAARVILVLLIGIAVAKRMTAEAEGVRSIPWMFGLLAIGLWAVAGELILRAALVSELFLAVTLLLATRYRQTGERRDLVLLPILFLVWGNLHSGVIFGLYVLGLQALEALVRRRAFRPYLLALGASVLASLCNPNGYEVWLYPFRLSRILFASGIAWDLGHFSALGALGSSAFLILVVLLLAGLLPLTRWRELSLAEILGILTFAALSFRTPRFVFHFVILALPVLYRLHARREWSPGMRRILAGAVPAVLALIAATLWLEHPRRLLDRRLPAGAVRFLEARGVRGRVFHHQNFGGFLLWRTRRPIFWDGRNDVFASLVKEVTTTPFPQIAKRYGIDVLLVTEREFEGLRPEIPERWGLVHWDDHSALYLRRDAFAPLLARTELGLFPPFGGRPGLETLARDPRLGPLALRELDRVLAVDPEIQRALYFRGVIRLYQGRLDDARRDLEAALAIADNEQVRKLLAAVGQIRRRAR
ncbi:MAG TPA: hypothetical protein VF756_06420 [Thermoanaerobaculia bacterium]